MNPAHYHLLINHIPILGSLFGIILLGISFFKGNKTLLFTSLITLIVCAAITFPVNGTGEQAEEAIEHLEGVSHGLIHEHEEIAEIASLLNFILGGVALLTLLLSFKTNVFGFFLKYIVFIYAIVVAVFLFRAGNSGGEIRHPEIRKDFKASEHTPKTDTKTDKEKQKKEEKRQSDDD
jgi:hypothetical protein